MIRILRWHSINLVPHFTIYSVCSNETLEIAARGIDIMLFGLILQLKFPSTQAKRFYSSPIIGPLWSRRRKCWYRFNEINKENHHA